MVPFAMSSASHLCGADAANWPQAPKMYEVKEILDEDASGQFYYVAWANSDSPGHTWSPSWEHRRHLRTCPDIVADWEDEKEVACQLIVRKCHASQVYLAERLIELAVDRTPSPTPSDAGQSETSEDIVNAVGKRVTSPPREEGPDDEPPLTCMLSDPASSLGNSNFRLLEHVKKVWAVAFPDLPWADLFALWVGRAVLGQPQPLPLRALDAPDIADVVRFPGSALDLTLTAFFAHDEQQRDKALYAHARLRNCLADALGASGLRDDKSDDKSVEGRARALLSALECSVAVYELSALLGCTGA